MQAVEMFNVKGKGANTWAQFAVKKGTNYKHSNGSNTNKQLLSLLTSPFSAFQLYGAILSDNIIVVCYSTV
jgi:hypothetical protein